MKTLKTTAGQAYFSFQKLIMPQDHCLPMVHKGRSGNFFTENKELKWATSWKNLFIPYANNKGADHSPPG